MRHHLEEVGQVGGLVVVKVGRPPVGRWLVVRARIARAGVTGVCAEKRLGGAAPRREDVGETVTVGVSGGD